MAASTKKYTRNDIIRKLLYILIGYLSSHFGLVDLPVPVDMFF